MEETEPRCQFWMEKLNMVGATTKQCSFVFIWAATELLFMTEHTNGGNTSCSKVSSRNDRLKTWYPQVFLSSQWTVYMTWKLRGDTIKMTHGGWRKLDLIEYGNLWFMLQASVKRCTSCIQFVRDFRCTDSWSSEIARLCCQPQTYSEEVFPN